jgi:hypothetical protein
MGQCNESDDQERERSRIYTFGADRPAEGGAQNADSDTGRDHGPAFDLSADGKRLVLVPSDQPETPKGNLHMTILVHWFDELRRRVAAAQK